jgi:hypothetical protein
MCLIQPDKSGRPHKKSHTKVGFSKLFYEKVGRKGARPGARETGPAAFI